MFKAYAENQLNAKIKAVQDDKAGEYMSAAFHKFMDQCGIARRHSTRNRPQQNGVAERANRTISDHVTAMLNEANLPASFWALAVSAYVHVWNRLPTAPLPATTPYTEWFKRNRTLVTSGCLGALPMSISSETSENLCSLIWRSVSLWAIHLVTRAGSSTIQ